MIKKQLRAAKLMFKKSLDSQGCIDPAKVRQVLKEITKAKPARLAKILRFYKRLIETALKKEQVVVEAAGKISNQRRLTFDLIKKTGAKKILFKTNPKIVFGARITHGDWIYDATLDAKLSRLTQND